jgi:hypothetical protein
LLIQKKLKWRFFKQPQNKIRVFGNLYSRGNKQIRFLFNNIKEVRFINKTLNESFEFNYNILKGVYISPFKYKNLPYYFGKNKKLAFLLYNK